LTLTAGTRLGPYEIVAPLGAGGMGQVYRARDRELDRDVVPSFLSPAWLMIDPNFDPLRNNPRFQKLVAGAK
jgi:hypothetical protein